MDAEEKKKGGDPAGKGIPLKKLNLIMIVIACVLAVFLLYATIRTTGSYTAMRSATERFIACQQDASSLMDASDYLTEQVREFVVTGKPACVENYLQEVNTTRRRDKASEDLGIYFAGAEAYEFLQNALDRSNELTGTEYYAMRLVIEAKGYDLTGFPAEVSGLALTAEDADLTPEDMLAKATELVFGDEYQSVKSEIRGDVARCLDILVEEMKTQQTGSADRLLSLMREQAVLIGILIVSVFVLVLLTSYLVIRPLERSIAHIRNQQIMPVKGSAELQFMAKTYNTMFEQARRDQDQLSYDATHDDLTGLYNRGVFEKMRDTCDPENIAMLLVDVDEFKGVNDRYGHDVGDQILRKVAGLLHACFRSEDYVCRIGGDEFAVIMIHAGSSLRALVAGKMRALNERLQNPDDGLPPVSVSVGVAFGDREDPTEDIFKDADTALYRVKEAGRADCVFY